MGATSSMGPMYAVMGMTAASSVGTAFSQSAALKQQGQYQETLADANSRIAGVKADQTVAMGDIAASREDMKTSALVGQERAAAGASGTDVNVGSNVLVRIGDELVGKTNELAIRTNAARQAWGYRTQAIEDTYEGRFARMTADTEAQQTILSGGLAAISGPLSIYSNYSRWSRYMGGGAPNGGPPKIGP